jgi:hypothetical protein
MHTRRRDRQTPWTRMMLQGHYQANRLNSGGRITVTPRTFGTAHFRKMPLPARRAILQRYSIEPAFLLHVLGGNCRDLVDFHNLAANIPGKHETDRQTARVPGRTEIRNEYLRIPFRDMLREETAPSLFVKYKGSQHV